jgi:preprotein translocase subunit SecE
VTESATSKIKNLKIISGITTYFRQTRAELRKVTWLSRKETARLTGIVLAVTLGMAAFLGLIDYLLSLLFGLFL